MPLEQTFATSVCRENHGGIVTAMGGKSFLNAGEALGDPHFCLGAPSYVGYPRFNVKTYTGYHPEFLRRAWQGGERLVVALAVNSQYLATRAANSRLADLPTDDHSQMLRQLAFIRRMAEANPDIMEIALTPIDARRIILSGKLAVVPGIEIDNFGNFKSPTFVWGSDGREDLSGGTLPMEVLSDDAGVAAGQIAEKIDSYRAAGARQITAIHYIDGLFGGVPAFRPEPALINRAYTGQCLSLVEGSDIGISANLATMFNGFFQGLQLFALGGADLSEQQARGFQGDCVARNPGLDGLMSTINGQGLTENGRELYMGLMRAGMVIDSDHLSFRTKDDLIAMQDRFHYPVLSSHANPTGAGFTPADGTGPSNRTSFPAATSSREWRHADDDSRTDLYGTAKPEFLANEFSVRDSDIDAIRRSGGEMGLFLTGPARRLTYAGGWGGGLVRNDNAGSDKSWAQGFLYAAERAGGHGIALASDRPGTEQIAPRFGPYAAWALKEEPVLQHDQRTRERLAQSSTLMAVDDDTRNPTSRIGHPPVRAGLLDMGVAYDGPIRSWHPWLFEFGVDDLEEEDIWKALAFIEAFPGVDPASSTYNALPIADPGDPEIVHPDQPQKVQASSETGHWGRIEAYVRGWHAMTLPAALDAGFNPGDTPFERAAFFALRNGLAPCDVIGVTSEQRRGCEIGHADRDSQGDFAYHYWKARAEFDLWTTMHGRNAPLRRMVTGSRYWDFNLDGLGNYGMLPDFMQDLRNIGINANQMNVLFNSADDYINMWERAESAARIIPAHP